MVLAKFTDAETFADGVDEALEVLQAVVVGALASILLAPIKVGLGEVVDGGSGRLQLRFLAHQFVELFEGFCLLFSERYLLSVDRAVPALCLFSEIGLALPWHGLFRVTCIDSCICPNQ